MLTVQDAILTLQKFWTDRGCMVVQPFNTEVGAGTMNPATVLRVLGPEPWRVAYPEPSVRPDDSRYGENPNRLQTFTQFQVILKPDPGNPQELYLESLRALGIDIDAHDVRFVEDNWAQPAIGAWGLGWEVWLDGLEITQFTYFQQVGGQNLSPVSVEITYGIERIMMAVQGVAHVKDMQYAPGISYGEAFGQSEYEMSRYYLDEADIEANQALYDRYVAEAQHMVDERLPVPAHTYVLKASHAFNVLDARGAISTTQRATAFSTMRRLARDVSRLWVERREELGFPLLRTDAGGAEEAGGTSLGEMGRDMGGLTPPRPLVEDVDVALLPAEPRTFALEIGVEEMPPHVVDATLPAVQAALEQALAGTRLEHGAVSVAGTPRRIVATVADVAPREPDSEMVRKGPKVAAAYDSQGRPTKALEGFARGQKVSVDELERLEVDGAEHVGVRLTQVGRGALEVLAEVVDGLVRGLRSDKNMVWGDPELTFSRPVRWLVALWGEVVVPVTVSTLVAGRTTYVHRTDDQPHVTLDSADQLLPTLAERGLVLDPAQRRASVIEQAQALAAEVGGTVDVEAEAALVDEITNLVEEPVGVRGAFEERYLELPEQILTTVMRKHQRYLPVRDEQGALMPAFVTMANGACDPEAVAEGNAAVLRARYEDAAFFWEADLAVSPADFRRDISRLTFEKSLGSMDERAARIRDLATALGDLAQVDDHDIRTTLARAGELAKFDLSTQMVVELSSLAGTMAHEYALRAGESPDVAQALAEMEQPRTSADAVPVSTAGALLSLGDRFDLLMGMFAIGAKPTGSSDPFGLRRAAIGVARVLREHDELGAVTIAAGLGAAAERLRAQGVEVDDAAVEAAREFTEGRFGQQLRDEGVPAGLVAAVAPSMGEPGRVQRMLAELDSVRAEGGERFDALVEGTQRITRIVPAGTPAHYDAAVLTEPAEVALRERVDGLPDLSEGTLTEWLAAAGSLTEPLARFFDETLVMADDEHLRAARLGLLQTIVDRAPAGIDWKALGSALG